MGTPNAIALVFPMLGLIVCKIDYTLLLFWLHKDGVLGRNLGVLIQFLTIK